MRRRFLSNINKSISEYFTIEALEDGLTVSLSLNTCEYCIDNGSWNNLSANSNTPSINKGQTLSFKGKLTILSNNGVGTFNISKKCNLKGNIMSILYKNNFIGQNDLNGKDYAFSRLFYDCGTIIDASQLILPATTLADSCYSNMFKSCASLVTAPILPATTLAEYCYDSMFEGCTSLTTAPALPATELAYGCYSDMFYNCKLLTTAPELPATTLAKYCYANMFSGCTKLNYIKALFTTTPSTLYTRNWVNGVSSTGTFVKNKDATWNITGTHGIPTGWTVQTA